MPNSALSARVALLFSVAVGLVVVGVALAACSGLDPGPPDPHLTDPPEPINAAILGMQDAGTDAAGDAR